MKIYFNPRCSKCRIADKYLQERDIDVEKVLYLEESIAKGQLKEILSKGLTLDATLRKKEGEYKKFIEGKELTEDEIFNVIIKHPKILQRPIIVAKEKAIVARDDSSLEKAKSLI